MALTYSTRPARTRHLLQHAAYEDNYGYTMNFYQPMIDYLDAKAKGLQVNPPHLPWTSERGLRQYRPSNTVRKYNADEIVRLSRACAARADEILLNFRVQKRSPFSVKKVADASRLTKHIQTDTVVERSRERRRKRQEDLEDIIRRDTLQMLQRIHKMELDNDCCMTKEFKRSIRGKSSTQIAQALLSDAEHNIKTAKKEEDDFIAQTIMRSSRAVSRMRSGSPDGRMTSHATHIEYMDDRMVDKLDHRVSSSLHNVRRQLSSLNQKTVEFYADSRCGIDDKCWICRKVMRTHPKLHDWSYIYWH